MRIGVYGGSFNPIHNGHLKVAKKSIELLFLDKLILMPAYISPNKKYDILASSNDRFNMCKIATKNMENLEVSNEEISRAEISFTVDTLKKLEKKYENSKFFLIVGSDAFLGFETWKNYNDIVKLSTVCVVPRTFNDIYIIENHIKKLNISEQDMIVLNIKALSVSSTKIREKIASNKPVLEFLPFEVAEYIKENKLY